MNIVVAILKNIFAIIGLLGVMAFISQIVTSTPGTGWKWSEESRVVDQRTKSYIAIERGVHRDAVDRVRMVLVSGGERREVWSSYMRAEPEAAWKSSDVIGITYLREESHSYWPQVEVGNKIYNVNLSYKETAPNKALENDAQ